MCARMPVGLFVVLLAPALVWGQGAPVKKPATAISPTKVRLNVKDMPVDRAVAELSRASGYFIFLGDEEGTGELRKRKVTLDTGDVAFWDAYGRLCDQGKLVEGAGVALAPKELPKLPPTPKVGDPIPLIKFGDNTPLFRTMPEVLNLKDGTRTKDGFGVWRASPMPPQPPTDAQTAVRVQGSNLWVSFNRDAAPAAGQVRAELKLTLEPKLQWVELVGTRIDRAVDDSGQVLLVAKDDAAPKFGGKFGGGAPQFGGAGLGPVQGDHFAYVPVRLAKGAKPSATLKELKGTISAKVSALGTEVLAVDDVAKSQGKVVKGAKGGTIKVTPLAVRNDQTGVQISVELNLPAQFLPAPRQGNTATPLPGLTVLDAGGKPIPIVSMVSTGGGRDLTAGVTAVFLVTIRPAEEQAAAKVSYSTRQVVTVDIPFSLENVSVR